MSVILFTGAMLYADGYTADPRFAAMASYGPPTADIGLRELDPALVADDAFAGWPAVSALETQGA